MSNPTWNAPRVSSVLRLNKNRTRAENREIIHRMESQGCVKGTVRSVPDAYTRNFMFRDLVLACKETEVRRIVAR